MLDAAFQPHLTALQSEKLVVLVLPELLDGLPDLKQLRASFDGPIRRVLVCFAERADPALLARLAETNVETQILFGPTVDLPATKGVVLKAPPGTSATKLNEFALALSDVVLISAATQKAPRSDQIGKLVEQIRLLRKETLVVGEALPVLPPTVSVTKQLDPVTPGFWRSVACVLCGRSEQFVMAVPNICGFCWVPKNTIGKNLRDLSQCGFKNLLAGLRCFWPRRFSLQPYFAPDNWTTLAPDQHGRSPAAPIVVGFEAFDRTALFGAHGHRDLTWLTHLCAALAVFCAIGAQFSWAWVTAGGQCEGELAVHMACPFAPNPSKPPEAKPDTSTPKPSGPVTNVSPAQQSSGNRVTVAPRQDVQVWHFWLSMTEFVLLAAVIATWIFLQKANLQERWMACRLGAEQLRIARMSLPLLVLPPALATSEDIAAIDEKRSTETQFSFRALAEVKRIVREQGLPQPGPDFSIERARQWVLLIVTDQKAYHESNFRKLEEMKTGLERLTVFIFCAAAVGVGLHLWNHRDVWLFASAGLPALGAALHGAKTRLGIVHRSALSNDAAKELATVEANLDQLGKCTLSNEACWMRLRILTESAAEIMGRENTSWHGLVSRYTDELPA